MNFIYKGVCLMELQKVETWRGRTSFFDGGLAQWIGWNILGFIVTVFTFGICYPWAVTMVYGWKINHTVIEGRRMQFSGSAIGLFGHRSEEHTSELQSRGHLVCRLLLEKKK